MSGQVTADPAPVEVVQGDGPVILGLPHTGTFLPGDIHGCLNARGRQLADTDWHIHQLYDGLLLGATTVRATFHRYVIDANRGPQDESLYPGQNTTGLVPLTDFDGEPIWTEAPSAQEVQSRVDAFHTPYHAALRAEIERVHARHGRAVLYDCHSIRSVIPFLFDGVLPDMNIGTAGGVTCDPRIEAAAVKAAETSGRTWVLNGRFRGGWTTRHYGQPARGVHAIQMELAQSTYLAAEAPPFAYDAAKAALLRETLAPLLAQITELAPELSS